MVFASGWHPADSQLARSSKFVPLMTGLLEGRTPAYPGRSDSRGFRSRADAGRSTQAGKDLTVHKPDGTIAAVPRGSAFFTDTGQPGVYTVDTPDGPRSFAVNLDPLESKTAALEDVTLQKLGLPSGEPFSETFQSCRAPADV